MQSAEHHRQKTQPKETLPAKPNVSLPRAIVLHNENRATQTLGFPPLVLVEPKRVVFSTPLCARCVSADGVWSENCLVLCVWDSGAELQASLPGDLDPFFLLFTTSPRPVSRQCRRVSTRGDVIEVGYLRTQPAFLLNEGTDS